MTGLVCVCIAVACTAKAQIYQVGPDAVKKPQAQTSPSQPREAQQSGQNLGWGSNIQNARLARAAELALQKGDHAQAYDFARRAVQATPNDPQLWFLLGYAARLDGRYQEAVDAYSRGLRLNPSSLEGLSGQAQVYSQMGRVNDAQQILQKVIDADPKRRDDTLMLGELKMRSRDYAGAVESLRKAEQLGPNGRSELLLALSYQNLKQMDLANQYLELAKRRAPNDPDVERTMAGYYREAGNYADAIAALKSIRNPKPDILAELGYTYQLDGKFDDSARLYTRAADAMPKDKDLQLAAAQAEISAGSVGEADAFLKRAAAVDPNYYRLHAIRGRIGQLQDRDEDAVKEFKAALAALPANPAEGSLYGIQLHMDLDALYHELGNEDAAHQELQTAQAGINAPGLEAGTGPASDQFFRLRATIKLESGDPDGALADVKEALALNASDRDDLQLDGDVLVKLGRPDDAIVVFKRVLDQDPANRAALTALGYASRAAGRDQDAEKYFQQLAKIAPSLYVPYLALGDLYTSRHDFKAAQASYSKGFALAPKNALIVAGGVNAAIEAHNLEIASVWVARMTDSMYKEPQILREKERYLSFERKYADSEQVARQAIQVLPRDRDVVVYLGYDLLYQEKYDELQALASKYLDVFPKEPDLPLFEGYVDKRNGQKEQAIQDFDEALKRDPNAVTAYVNRGYEYNDLHHPQQGASDFEQALQREPNNGEAHLGLAYASLDLHKPQAALDQASLAQRVMGDSRDIHVIRATAYGDEDMLTKAAAEYRAALKYTPNDGSLHLGLGNTFFSERQYRQAIDEFNTVEKLSPSNSHAEALLARSHASLGEREQAFHDVQLAEKNAQSLSPEEQGEIFISTGEALSTLNDQNAAMDRFRKALDVAGSDRIGVRLAIAQLQAEQNHPEDAERQIALAWMESTAGESDPPTGVQYIAAADVFRSVHEYELSQTYLQRAKLVGAPDPEVRIGLANNYLALGDTPRAQAQLSAVSATNDNMPTYQYLIAEASVQSQEHQGAKALTSFAEAANAAGDDQAAEQSMLAAGADEGMRIAPQVSVLSDFSVEPIYEDSTVYVLDSKLDTATPIPSSDSALLPTPRSSIQTQWTDAFHLHFPHVPTPGGFFQMRNARGEISAPSTICPAGSNTTGGVCTVIVDRNTTDYSFNVGLAPTVRFGDNALTFDGGIQETLRRDSLQPVAMNQNLFRLFLYMSSSSFFNAVSVSGYVIRETGPFTESAAQLHSQALTGAIDFRVGAPWGKTALITGWGYNDTSYKPQTYEAYFTSSYVGLERRFTDRLDIKAMVEDVRAWRVFGNNSAIAQNLRPAGTVLFVPRRNWSVQLDSAYSSTRGFHVYDAAENGLSVSYSMPFRRRFNDDSGDVVQDVLVILLEGSSRNLMACAVWDHVEFSAIEENPEAVIRKGPEASGGTFDALYFTVESFGCSVRDRVAHIGEEVLKVSLEHLGDFDNWR